MVKPNNMQILPSSFGVSRELATFQLIWVELNLSGSDP